MIIKPAIKEKVEAKTEELKELGKEKFEEAKKARKQIEGIK